MKIAKVVVDLSLNREFDYIIPPELDQLVQIGSQVIVPFGRRQAKGYVVGLSDTSERSDLKPIIDKVGRRPLVDEKILDLAKWMATYYLTPIEQAVRAVLPSAVRKKGPAFRERLFVIPEPLAGDEQEVQKLRSRASKQVVVLDALRASGPTFLHELLRSTGATVATVRGLERRGFVRLSRQAEYRDPHAGHEFLRTQPLELMPQQVEALKLVVQSADTLTPPVVLLFGVTGSGKTEVYMQAIDHVLRQGRGAIMLVPEISLTPQTVDRFKGRFGDCVAVLHSELSEGERHDEWHRVHEGKATIAIGARSALFAPIQKLGLIVVDEEHESTYKQEDAPRYSARDVAVMRGHMEGCAVVLGSATPSLESLYNAQRGKYAQVRLPHRVDHQKMPVMHIVDMRAEMAREGRVNVLSRDLCNAIDDRLHRAEQTILFLNRRGFATSLVCPRCGYVAHCEHCSVAMTYHKPSNRLMCHICGAFQDVPSRCPNKDCQDPAFRYAGMGTQRVEEIVGRLFSRAKIQRMDSDSMSHKSAYRRTLGDFRSGHIDILIGTQMIAKGLHFPNVTLVGVVNADLSLHMPDFRSGERTFQLLTQVAGRAGRGDVVGEVIVQTFTPHHLAIQAARRLDYDGFFDQEIEYRHELNYPPFSHLVCVTLRGKSEELIKFAGESFVKNLGPRLDSSVTMGGLTPAPIAKAKGEFRYQVILRATMTSAITEPLRQIMQDFPWPEDVHYSVDVDAQSLL